MLYRRAEDLDRSPSRRASLCARERPAVEHQARIGGAHLIKLEEASDSSAKASIGTHVVGTEQMHACLARVKLHEAWVGRTRSHRRDGAPHGLL